MSGKRRPRQPTALADGFNRWNALKRKSSVRSGILIDGRSENVAPERTKAGSGARQALFPRDHGCGADQEPEAGCHRGRNLGIGGFGKSRPGVAGAAEEQQQENARVVDMGAFKKTAARLTRWRSQGRPG